MLFQRLINLIIEKELHLMSNLSFSTFSLQLSDLALPLSARLKGPLKSDDFRLADFLLFVEYRTIQTFFQKPHLLHCRTLFLSGATSSEP